MVHEILLVEYFVESNIGCLPSYPYSWNKQCITDNIRHIVQRLLMNIFK